MVHTFPYGISLKANVIAQLEFEFVFYNVAVHYTMETMVLLHLE